MLHHCHIKIFKCLNKIRFDLQIPQRSGDTDYIAIYLEICFKKAKQHNFTLRTAFISGERKYAPSVFEKYTTSITVGNKEVILNLYDTAGQEDYDRLRPLSYQNTNMVLICYDVMNPTSYDNVLIKWYPEISHFCRGVPLILIGCKTDLRKDKEHLRKLMSSEQEPITYTQGEATCQQMKAQAYLECSAKCRENIEDVFKEATNIALNAMKKAKRRKKRKRCSIL
ncbi:rho-related GTP-binding protein RhoF isoform X1 [Lepidochelys kempii]|uniref:rho-related GTP-binding protein RhoF isoform X1 n=1 Tax=Caretta caretta TaxID=8467 RepID=UPI002094A8AD|nr:rho-related GTP-binding protein RhoF isoform X1 [Caretta caretta]